MSEIVKSDNEQGNPWHKGKGPGGGQFTSADGSNASGSSSEVNETKRGHVENPIWEEMQYVLYDYETDNDEEYDRKISEVQHKYDKEAFKMIMEDTGYNEQEALVFHHTLLDYLGGDYELFSAGYRPEEAKIIDEGIKRMPKYEGEILRGAHFDDNNPQKKQRFLKLLESLKPGAEINMRDTPTSWTSNEFTALDNFGRIDYPNFNTVIFVCDKNKSGASVQHISKFGEGEAEIIVPSNARYRVKDVKVDNKKIKKGISSFFTPTTKTAIVYLEEI